jgi:RNA polymerase sigma-70 factor (ECF subfamily)
MPQFASCLPAFGAITMVVRPARRRMSSSDESTSAALEAQNVRDTQLMQRMAGGDRDAFAELYDRLSRPLYTTAWRILNDAREAEDIVQEVFLALWQKSSDFERNRGTAFSWAMTLTRNRSIDRIRMRKRRGELLAQSAPEDLGYNQASTSDDSGDDVESKERAAAVRQAIAALPSEQQQALKLAFFTGLTQQEIAAQLSQPLGTIKARIRRGLLKLRDTVAPRI